MLSDPLVEIKGPEHIRGAMQYYQEKQLGTDLPMREILNDEIFNARLVRS